MASEKQWLKQKWLVTFFSVLVILLVFLGWFDAHGSGIPSYVGYVLIALLAGLIPFIFTGSSALLEGNKFGFKLNVSGVAAILVLVLGAGIWYEFNVQKKSFAITMYFKERLGNGAQLVDASGKAMLLLDEPKERSLTKGWVRFEGIPSSFLGEPIHLEVRVDGYVKDGFLSEQVPVNFEQGKTYHYFLKKALPPPPEQSVDAPVSANNPAVEPSTPKRIEFISEEVEVRLEGYPVEEAQELLKSIPLFKQKVSLSPIMDAESWEANYSLAEQGNTTAQMSLLASSVQRGDAENEQYWLDRVLKNAKPTELNSLAVMYLEGVDLPQDIERGLALLIEAAEQGDAEAQYNLGVLYEKGVFGEPDLVTAKSWYQKSAEQGFAPAQQQLAVLAGGLASTSPDSGDSTSAIKQVAGRVDGFDCQWVIDVPEAECLELVEFYNSTGGDDWSYNTDWLRSYTVCEWYGIECDLGSVVKIELTFNRLRGKIPNFNLPKLQKLHLWRNELSGEIPNFNLPKLQKLHLWRNELSGEIPNFNLPKLQTLSLWANQLSGEIPNFNLPKLQGLNLGLNKLSGEIPNFNLPKLQALYLDRNQLSGEIPNFNLPKLQELYLSGNELSGEIPNFNLPKLQEFSLSANKLSGEIPDFNLPKLQALHLSSNKLSGEIPNFNLPKLQLLYLWANQLCHAPATNYQPQVSKQAKQYPMCQSP